MWTFYFPFHSIALASAVKNLFCLLHSKSHIAPSRNRRNSQWGAFSFSFFPKNKNKFALFSCSEFDLTGCSFLSLVMEGKKESLYYSVFAWCKQSIAIFAFYYGSTLHRNNGWKPFCVYACFHGQSGPLISMRVCGKIERWNSLYMS